MSRDALTKKERKAMGRRTRVVRTIEELKKRMALSAKAGGEPHPAHYASRKMILERFSKRFPEAAPDA